MVLCPSQATRLSRTHQSLLARVSVYFYGNKNRSTSSYPSYYYGSPDTRLWNNLLWKRISLIFTLTVHPNPFIGFTLYFRFSMEGEKVFYGVGDGPIPNISAHGRTVCGKPHPTTCNKLTENQGTLLARKLTVGMYHFPVGENGCHSLCGCSQ